MPPARLRGLRCRETAIFLIAALCIKIAAALTAPAALALLQVSLWHFILKHMKFLLCTAATAHVPINPILSDHFRVLPISYYLHMNYML